MNKFSNLSNTEINVAIAKIIFKDKPMYKILCDNDYVFLYMENSYVQTLNFLDHAQIFILMVDNKINLEYNKFNEIWCARSQPKTFKHKLFEIYDTLNKDPARAVAECFLLINDGDVNA